MRPSRSRRRITPPNSVDPSWVHDLLAALTVKALQGRGFSAGEVTDDFVRAIPGAEDSPEPALLLARIYAHLAWRLPGIRSLAKRFEGRERKAGLGSDSFALAVQLYLRNREQIATFQAEAARKVEERRATEAARKHERGGATAASVFAFKRDKPTTPETPAERSA